MGGRASAASKNAWNARNYDRINLTVPKGQKETIKNHAEARGESVNGFINGAIDTVIQQDNAEDKDWKLVKEHQQASWNLLVPASLNA